MQHTDVKIIDKILQTMIIDISILSENDSITRKILESVKVIPKSMTC